jgi:hypothetical protein
MDALEIMHRHDAEQRLAAFVAESNRIEGIHREPSPEEIKAHRTLVARKKVKVEHVTQFVAVCQPNTVLRATTDIYGVRVGNHVAPPSGPKIVEAFDLLLKQIANGALTPWAAHVRYDAAPLYRWQWALGPRCVALAHDALGTAVARAGNRLSAHVLLPDIGSKSLVQPSVAGGRALGRGRVAGADEF